MSLALRAKAGNRPACEAGWFEAELEYGLE